MPSSFVMSQLRRTSINLLLFNAVLVGGALVTGAVTSGRIAGLVQGPWAIERATLLATVDPDALRRTYVTVAGSRVAEIGDYGEGTGESRRFTAKFAALEVGDRVLIVKTPVDEADNLRFTGYIVEMPEDMRRDLLAAWTSEDGTPAPFLPIMLDAEEGNLPTWLLIGGLVVVIALGLRNVWVGVARLRDHSEHPSWKALAAYGSPAANAASIDGEVSRGTDVVEAGSLRVTPTWLVHRGSFAVTMLPLAQIVWYYKHVTKHYTNFIPTGKTFALHVHDQQGKLRELQAKEKHVDRLLEALHARAPWAIGGWNPDIAAAMAGPQRAEVAREVESRRRAARPAA